MLRHHHMSRRVRNELHETGQRACHKPADLSQVKKSMHNTYMLTYSNGDKEETDSSLACWLTDYLLFIVYTSLLVHLIYRSIKDRLPLPTTISWSMYYGLFASSVLAAGVHHHLAYLAEASKDQVRRKSLEVGAIRCWQIVMFLGIMSNASMMGISAHVALTSEAAFIVVCILAPVALVVAFLAVRARSFRVLIGVAAPAQLCCTAAFIVQSVGAGVVWCVGSTAAVMVQLCQVAPSKRHFNHNAFFHLLQAFSCLPMHLAAMETVRSP